jgi:hypothetical protein
MRGRCCPLGQLPLFPDGVSAVQCETAADGSPKVDAWASKQDDQPGRTEAIRRLVEIGLKAKK